mgnify:CR=1 FL=1
MDQTFPLNLIVCVRAVFADSHSGGLIVQTFVAGNANHNLMIVSVANHVTQQSALDQSNYNAVFKICRGSDRRADSTLKYLVIAVYKRIMVEPITIFSGSISKSQ